MKQIISMCLLICSILILCACDSDSKKPDNTVAYYYQVTQTDYSAVTGMIISEIRDTNGRTDDYPYLIKQYLSGPKSYDCISPFPAGTTLEEFNIDSNTAQVVLSPQITTLSGVELTFACACITRTVIEMTCVRSVQISTTSGTLGGEDTITMTANSFILQNVD